MPAPCVSARAAISRESAVEDRAAVAAGVVEVVHGIDVVDADSRAGHDVVEHVEKHALPDVFEARVGVGAGAEIIDGGELFSVL